MATEGDLMEKAILIINAGSSSIKFAVFICDKNKTDVDALYYGVIEGIGNHAHLSIRCERYDTAQIDQSVAAQNHDDALQILLSWIEHDAIAVDIVAVGHRVVHGGTFFSSAVIINDEVDFKLEELIPLAPLHQAHSLAAIRTFKQLQPQWLQVACFDTAFHRTMPRVAQSFAIPFALFDEGVRRYGFHGLSYEYVASCLPDLLGAQAHARVIVAHLGHGASMCAMKDLKSITTTMSFTPLDGLPMATRSGVIDPAVLLYLMREKNMSINHVSEMLHHQSGLLGVSGISDDIRELLASDNPHAKQAIDLFVYRITCELGSLAAALGGLDALVFTAGIGENASEIRKWICNQASWLGVELDESANTTGKTRISKEESSVSVWVIPTNEELIIAHHTFALLNN